MTRLSQLIGVYNKCGRLNFDYVQILLERLEISGDQVDFLESVIETRRPPTLIIPHLKDLEADLNVDPTGCWNRLSVLYPGYLIAEATVPIIRKGEGPGHTVEDWGQAYSRILLERDVESLIYEGIRFADEMKSFDLKRIATKG